MSYARKLRRNLKVVKDQREPGRKTGTAYRRVLWTRTEGDYEVWFHATKGHRCEQRHLPPRGRHWASRQLPRDGFLGAV